MQQIQSWHCDYTNDGGIPPTLTGADCTVTASTTYSAHVTIDGSSTPAISSTEQMTFYDTLFVACVIIFFLSFIGWGYIFSFVRKGENKLK